jgi:multicomponent Na+:H+ antiporter subunit E
MTPTTERSMIRGPERLRRGLRVAMLVTLWCALWRNVEIGTVVSGVAVAVVVDRLPLGVRTGGGVRPVAVLRLLASIAVDLVRSTVEVMTEILTPGDGTNEGIVAIALPPHGRQHFLLFVIAITVTPGTAVVDLDGQANVVYVHLLDLGRRASVEAGLLHLAELAEAAFPTMPPPGTVTP